LLKGGHRSGLRSVNRSFQNYVAQGSHVNTEHDRVEMSVISAKSEVEDEDIVIDSGGRQINHMHNW